MIFQLFKKNKNNIFIIIFFVILCFITSIFRKQIHEKYTNNTIQDKLIYPIYWINLDKSKDRQHRISSQLTKFNITKHKRISGIDGQQLHKYNFVIPDTDRSNSELGCLLSHITAILTALKDNLNFAFIAEDDICLSVVNKWKYNIDDIINQAPVDWEILQLHVIDSHNIKYLLQQQMPFVEWTQRYYGAMCYLINRNGMNKIKNDLIRHNRIQLPRKHILTSDTFIYKICKTYTYTLPLFVHRGETSTIHNEHVIRHQKAKNTLLKYFNIKSIDC
jgi:GR25 family glycosyltransferase involved in LPS biosynthesis